MRIALVGGDPGYLLNFRGRLAADLVARGHEVFAVAGGDDPAVRVGLSAVGATYRPYALERSGTGVLTESRSVLALHRIFRECKPDVVLAFSPKVIAYATCAARLAGVRRVVALVTGLGTAFTDTTGTNRTVNSVAKVLLGGALRAVDLAIFQNPDDRRDLIHAGVLPRRVPTGLVNGSGVPLDLFPHVPPDLTGPVRFLLVGRIQREKGVYEYAAAARALRSRGADAIFALVGAIDDHPAAIDRTDLAEWQETGLLDWTGPAQNVLPHLERCTVFVLPSYREGTPRSVLEAMAVGRAVITTDVPGCRETVQHEHNGLLVPAREATSLADAMSRFVADRPLAATMGARSRARAVEKYDVRAVNAAVIALLEPLGDRPPRVR